VANTRPRREWARPIGVRATLLEAFPWAPGELIVGQLGGRRRESIAERLAEPIEGRSP
jgi:hypothetical protein